jgi:UDP-glucose:(heptosyl)LPS alpha-1,3-glucosyltransferase
MKIAFIVEHLDPNRGGMERSVVDFLTELTASGAEVHVVTQTSAWSFPGIHVHLLGAAGWTDESQYKNFVLRAQALVTSQQWDVVHAIRPCMSCDIYQPRGGLVKTGQDRTIATRRSGLFKIFRRIGLWFDGKERLLVSLEHRLLKNTIPPLVIVPSEYVRRQLEERYSLPDEHVRRVFNGVRVEVPEQVVRGQARQRLRETFSLPEPKLVAIFVGHNFRRKGLARMIESLARPAAQAWHLLVVGRGAVAQYERYAEQLGVSNRIRFVGSRPDVWGLYCAADVCVLPTYNDPCSRTILEALSLGLPCITTAYDGSSECIRDGEHGFVIDSPESIDALANALEKLSDASTRRYMSEQATALGSFLSMRRHATEVFELYRDIAARRSLHNRAGSA